MSQAPAMPVFTDALIGDTTHLSAEEFGAYCLILFATWNNGGVAFGDNDRRMARICRVSDKRWLTRLRPALVGFFDLSAQKWRQKRLEKEWIYIANIRERNSVSGKASALKRKETTSTVVEATLQRNGQRNGNENPTPIPIPSKKVRKKDSEAYASGADAPDPVRDLWSRGKAILGDSAASLIGKARKLHGDLIVLQAIAACETERPSQPVEFFIGCLRAKKENPHDAETRAFRLVAERRSGGGANSPLAVAFLDPAGAGRHRPSGDGG